MKASVMQLIMLYDFGDSIVKAIIHSFMATRHGFSQQKRDDMDFFARGITYGFSRPKTWHEVSLHNGFWVSLSRATELKTPMKQKKVILKLKMKVISKVIP